MNNSVHLQDSELWIVWTIGALVVWRVVWRLRRMVGRQQMGSGWTQRLGVAFFGLLLIVIFGSLIVQPLKLLVLCVGITTGVLIGQRMLKLTSFEHTPEGLFYTPNSVLGLALSALLLARMAYRFFYAYRHGTDPFFLPQEQATSPFTLFLVGALLSSYLVHALGLLRWRKDALDSDPGYTF